ncbi:hypothetical protein LRX75_10135 [Rhizobium sp. DKSPLA3]|uniref:Uncharacterized protein n=1 Tax=Rhizobium quercicola TaxID=2901226 RepID=A0A9X1NS44_9HYPH|nr:hypothetical protein [Rhizobium quercicola]MCD7109403.1 hypothetical protein [Rhizobium quercicola]
MTTNKRYQVEQHIVCDGWTNTWTEEDEDGVTMPQTFTSRAEAHAAIQEFLLDVREANASRYMTEFYRRVDFRVRVVRPQDDAEA